MYVYKFKGRETNVIVFLELLKKVSKNEERKKCDTSFILNWHEHIFFLQLTTGFYMGILNSQTNILNVIGLNLLHVIVKYNINMNGKYFLSKVYFQQEKCV